MFVFWMILIMFFSFPIFFAFIFVLYKSRQCKRQRLVNETCLSFLEQNNFKITKILELEDSNTIGRPSICKKSIYIDDEARYICLVDYINADMFIISFNDILNYETYDNNSQSMIGSGYTWGKKGKLTTYESKTIEKCKDLRLIIRTKNSENYQVTYDLVKTIFNIGINKAGSTYRECISSLQNVISFLEVIISQSKINKTEDFTKKDKR